MQLKQRKSFKFKFLSRIFGSLNGVEMAFVAIVTAIIQFKIEGVLLQSLISIAAVMAIACGFIYQSEVLVNSNRCKNWLKQNGRFSLIAVGLIYALVTYIIFDPIPAHAVLFKAEKAITAAITTNMEDKTMATALNGIIITFLWIIRLVILGYLGQQGLKIFNERDEENWIKLLKTPAIFIVTIGILNTVATYIVTGGAT